MTLKIQTEVLNKFIKLGFDYLLGLKSDPNNPKIKECFSLLFTENDSDVITSFEEVFLEKSALREEYAHCRSPPFSIDILHNLNKTHNIIGYAHTHPDNTEPSRLDLKSLENLENFLDKDCYGLIAGGFLSLKLYYAIAAGNFANKSFKTVVEKGLGHKLEIANKLGILYEIDNLHEGWKKSRLNTKEDLMEFLTTHFIKTPKFYRDRVKMYNSHGNEIHLEII